MYKIKEAKLKTILTWIFCIIFISCIDISLSFSQSYNDQTLKEAKDKEGYIINLKDLLEESKKKMGKVNEEIKAQAIKKRNMQREARAREYYQKAMEYYHQGKLEEAQKLWEKAIRITSHPEMKGYIRESVKKKKKEEEALKDAEKKLLERLELERGYSASEVEKTYQEAVSLFKQKKFIEAKYDFEKVEEMFPDHKATRSYLMVIEQDIKKEQQRLIANSLKEEAEDMRRAKEKWRREIDKREQERKEEIRAQAESVYQLARKLYSEKKFKESKEKFQEVEWISPNYKSTQHFLSHIDIDIETSKILSFQDRQMIYTQQIGEDKLDNLKKQNEIERQKQIKEEERVKRLEEEADFVYQSALELFKKGDYEKAQEKLTEVQEIYQDYKSTVGYLTKVDKKLSEKQKERELEKQKVLDERLRQEQFAKQKLAEQKRLQKELEEQARIERLEQEANSLYSTAIDLFNKEFYVQAKDKFEELQKKFPSYKSTLNYISKINDKIAEKEMRKFSEQDELLAQKIQKEMEIKQQALDRSLKLTKEEEEERIQKLMGDAEVIYNTAITLYQKKLYVQAKNKFMEVNAFFPNYKATIDYLVNIEKEIAAEEQRKLEEKQRALEEKIRTEKLAKSKEEERRRLQKEFEEREHAKKIKQEAEFVYNSALLLFKKELYPQAKEQFSKVEELYPSYKSAASYISKCDEMVKKYDEMIKEQERKGLEKQKKQEELAKKLAEEKRNKEIELQEQERLRRIKEEAELIYASAITLYDESIYLPSKEKFAEVDKIYPDYKKTRSYIEKINKDLNKIEEQKREAEERAKKEKERLAKLERKRKEEEAARLVKMEEERKQRELEETAEPIYEQAIDLLKQEQYVKAKESFEEVNKIYPEFKSATNYIERIEKTLVRLEEKRKLEEERARKEKERLAELERKKQEEEKARLAKMEEERKQRELEETAESIYEQAIDLLKQEQYVKAKESFEEVNKIYPEFKSATNYIERIEKTLVRLEEKRKLEEERARKEKERLAELERKKQEEEKARLAKMEEERKQRELEETAEPIYEQAMDLYENMEYVKSKERFAEVNKIYPGFKYTERYIEKLENDMPKLQEKKRIAEERAIKEKQRLEEIEQRKKKEQEERLARIEEERKLKEKEENARTIYDQAMDLFRQEKFKEAKETFERVSEVYPGYKYVGTYIVKAEKLLVQAEENEKKAQEEALKEKIRLQEKEKQRKEKELADKFSDLVETRYREAIDIYNSKQYANAKDKFLEVKGLQPAYKDTEKYIVKSDKGILTKKEENKTEEQKLIEEKVRRIQEENRKREREKIRQARLEKEKKKQELVNNANALYKQALSLYRNKKYNEANEKFIKADHVVPGFKSTERYLAKIDKNIAALEEDKYKAVSVKKETSREEDKNKKEEKKIDKTKLRSIIFKQKDEELARLKEKIEPTYKLAVNLYKQKDYEGAREKFILVSSVSQGYESTDYYLKKIEKKLEQIERKKQKEIERQEREEARREAIELRKEELAAKREEKEMREERLSEPKGTKPGVEETEDAKGIEKLVSKVQPTYRFAIDLYKKKDYETARSKFILIDKVYPDYKLTRRYLQKIDKKLNKSKDEAKVTSYEPDLVKKAEDKKIQQLKEEAEKKYMAALELYNNEDYADAKVKFIQTEAIYPNYKKTLFYLSGIDSKIEEGKGRKPGIASTKTKAAQVSTQDVILGNEKLKDAMNAGIILFKAQEYTSAKIKFVEALKIDPSDKKAKRYLDATEKRIKKEINKSSSGVAILSSDKLKGIPWEEKAKERVTSLVVEQERQEYLKKAEYNALRKKISAEERIDEKRKLEYKKMLDEKRRAMKYEIRKEKLKKLRVEREFLRLHIQKRRALESAAKEEEKQKTQDEKEKNRLAELEEEIRINELNNKVDPIYDEAMDLYKSNKYDEAKEKLIEVNDLCPGYKNTENILSKIDNDKVIFQSELREKEEKEKLLQEKNAAIEREIQEKEKLRLEEKEKKESVRRAKEEELAKIREEKNMRRLEAKKQKELELKAKKDEIAKRKEEQEKIRLEAKRQKELALEAKIDEITKKKEEKKKQNEVTLKTKEVEKVSRPKDKEEMKIKIEPEAEKDSEANEEDKKNRELALQKKMEELKAIQASKNKSRKYTKSNIRKRKIVKKQSKRINGLLNVRESEKRKRWAKEVKAIYREAVKLMKQGDYVEAKIKFSLVEGLSPGYKKAKAYKEYLSGKIVNEEEKLRSMALNEQKRVAREEEEKKNQEAEAEKQRLQKEKKQKETILALKDKEEREAQSAAEKERQRKEREARAAISAEEKQKALEEKNKSLEERQEAAKVIKEVEDLYKEFKGFYRKKDYDVGLDKLDEITKKLEADSLDNKYVKKMRAKVVKYKDKITMVLKRMEETLKNKEEKTQELARKKEEALKLKNALEEEKARAKEKIELQKQVEIEQKRLAKLEAEKEYRMNKEKARQEEINRKEEAKKRREEEQKRKEEEAENRLRLRQEEELQRREEVPSAIKEEEKAKKVSEVVKVKEIKEKTKHKEQIDAASKEQELKDLALKRQQELKEERLRIKKEYEENLRNVYLKAIKLYKEGFYPESKALFESIDQMRPDYRATNRYLVKLHNKIANEKFVEQRQDTINEQDDSKALLLDIKSREDKISDILDSMENSRK